MSLTTRPDCDSCRDTWKIYDDSPPCGTCFPGVHQYNAPIVELHRTCSDQVITGPGGIVGLNDMAIGYAMDNYFEVERKDREWLSLGVRKFSSMILEIQRNKAAKKDG